MFPLTTTFRPIRRPFPRHFRTILLHFVAFLIHVSIPASQIQFPLFCLLPNKLDYVSYTPYCSHRTKYSCLSICQPEGKESKQKFLHGVVFLRNELTSTTNDLNFPILKRWYSQFRTWPSRDIEANVVTRRLFRRSRDIRQVQARAWRIWNAVFDDLGAFVKAWKCFLMLNCARDGLGAILEISVHIR